jgi:hypothetical protein
MRICSWDVGIVHLAYCIIEYLPDTEHRFKILGWNQINLAPKPEVDCCGSSKNGDCCNKPAKFSYLEEAGDGGSGEVGYCGTHKKHCNHAYIPVKTKNVTCDFSRKNSKNPVKCGKPACYLLNGETKQYFCKKHIDKKTFPVLKPIVNMSANKIPIQILQKRLLEILNDMNELMGVDRVVIENQPSLKNPRMKSIASTLYDFFLMRSTIDKKACNSKIEMVTYMSPSNKIKVDEKNSIKVLSRAKGSATAKYKLTKQLAIKYCKRLIKHDKKYLRFLESNKKQDDLCDSYLQGCYYLVYKQ